MPTWSALPAIAFVPPGVLPIDAAEPVRGVAMLAGAVVTTAVLALGVAARTARRGAPATPPRGAAPLRAAAPSGRRLRSPGGG